MSRIFLSLNIMTRAVLLLAFIIHLTINLVGQSKSVGQILPGDFGKIMYDSVVIYECVTKNWTQIASGKKLNEGIIVKSHTLSKSQSDSLRLVLFNTKTYGAYPPQCFNYNLGVVFYKSHEIACYASISFECNAVSPSHEIDAMKKESFRDKKYDFAYYNGLSKIGMDYFIRLCNQFEFSYPKFKK